LHQTATIPDERLTTNHGVPLSDNQNSLKGGPRGPTLLEDMILREKIQHFDHERIPERIVHARGSGAHGYFELTKSLAKYSRAKVLTEVGAKTEVFVRFSTVAGGAGSVDTPRDVRGFAVKLYTKEGKAKAFAEPKDLEPSPSLRIIGKYPPSLKGRTIALLVTEGADGKIVKALSQQAAADGATVKIVAPRVGGVTLKGGGRVSADGQLAGMPSVLFDAVALVLSDEGCSELLKESAALEFVQHAFAHLKAIGYTRQAMPLLEKSNVETDEGVIDVGEDMAGFLSQARTRVWAREPGVRTLRRYSRPRALRSQHRRLPLRRYPSQLVAGPRCQSGKGGFAGVRATAGDASSP